MFLYFLTLISICFCVTGKPNREGDKYDQLLFSQKQPVSAYYELRKTWPTRNTSSRNSGISDKACEALFNPNRWIIRGLWPQRNIGHSPLNCIRRIPGYVASFLGSALYERLDLHWPSLIANLTLGFFWDYEWHRYGSCTTNIESMNTVDKYFDKALEFLNEYNIGSMLQTYGIISGNNYTVDNIYQVVEFNYQVKPMVKCVFDYESRQQEQYLSEVILCFNKRLLLINCFNFGMEHCDNTQAVIYPKILL